MPSSCSLRYCFVATGAFGYTHLHVAGTQEFKSTQIHKIGRFQRILICSDLRIMLVALVALFRFPNASNM